MIYRGICTFAAAKPQDIKSILMKTWLKNLSIFVLILSACVRPEYVNNDIIYPDNLVNSNIVGYYEGYLGKSHDQDGYAMSIQFNKDSTFDVWISMSDKLDTASNEDRVKYAGYFLFKKDTLNGYFGNEPLFFKWKMKLVREKDTDSLSGFYIGKENEYDYRDTSTFISIKKVIQD